MRLGLALALALAAGCARPAPRVQSEAAPGAGRAAPHEAVAVEPEGAGRLEDDPSARLYVHPHVIHAIDHEADDWREVRIEDELYVRPSGPDRVAFALLIVSTNYHTCSAEGEAVSWGGAYVYEEDPEEDLDGRPCRLHLRPTQDGFTLLDEGAGCREQCGVHASIDSSDLFRPVARSTRE